MAGLTQHLTQPSPSASPLRSDGKPGIAPWVVEGGRSQQQSLWLAAFLVSPEQQAPSPFIRWPSHPCVQVRALEAAAP